MASTEEGGAHLRPGALLGHDHRVEIGRRGRFVLDPLSQARAAVDEIDRQAFVFVLVGVGMP